MLFIISYCWQNKEKQSKFFLQQSPKDSEALFSRKNFFFLWWHCFFKPENLVTLSRDRILKSYSIILFLQLLEFHVIYWRQTGSWSPRIIRPSIGYYRCIYRIIGIRCNFQWCRHVNNFVRKVESQEYRWIDRRTK